MVAALVTLSLSAQEEKEAFKPSGKTVFKVFTNWHQGFGDDDIYTDDSGFELSRGVMGYQYQFAPNWSSKVIVDMADPGSGKLTEVAYIRNAYIAYKDDRLNAVFGIIGMKQFKTQENNWGYRYLYKSAMDEYKFNNSVDAGLYIKYEIADWMSADVTISNGEGAKSQQDTEGKYRMGYGAEIKPLDGLTFRAYYDYFYAPEPVAGTLSDNQDMLALFVGYEQEKFRVGVEYDILNNYKFVTDDNRDIFSVYGSVALAKQMQAFARYDMLMAEEALSSENVAIAGFEYNVVKGVKVSPNFRYINYTDSSQEDGGFFYLNFEYKF